MVIHIVYYVMIVLNCDVTKQGVLDAFSPRELVLRQTLDWVKHCTNKGKAIKFGEFVEAHEDTSMTNTT